MRVILQHWNARRESSLRGRLIAVQHGNFWELLFLHKAWMLFPLCERQQNYYRPMPRYIIILAMPCVDSRDLMAP